MKRLTQAEHGISERQLATLRSVIAPFMARIERIGVFGSRAVGAAKPWSDIDLVVYGDVHSDVIDRLRTRLIESDLLLKVDLHAYAAIRHAPLKAHIDAHAGLLFERADFDLAI